MPIKPWLDHGFDLPEGFALLREDGHVVLTHVESGLDLIHHGSSFTEGDLVVGLYVINQRRFDQEYPERYVELMEAIVKAAGNVNLLSSEDQKIWQRYIELVVTPSTKPLESK